MIEVFKTNVQDAYEASNMIQMLLEHFPTSKINFDLYDCDHILRIQDHSISIEKVINILIDNCFSCELLE